MPETKEPTRCNRKKRQNEPSSVTFHMAAMAEGSSMITAKVKKKKIHNQTLWPGSQYNQGPHHSSHRPRTRAPPWRKWVSNVAAKSKSWSLPPADSGAPSCRVTPAGGGEPPSVAQTVMLPPPPPAPPSPSPSPPPPLSFLSLSLPGLCSLAAGATGFSHSAAEQMSEREGCTEISSSAAVSTWGQSSACPQPGHNMLLRC